MELNTIWRNVAGFLPAFLWAIIVATLSLMSASLVSKLSWRSFIGLDKVAHLVCYLILGLLVVYGFFRLQTRYRYMSLVMAVGCILFGILVEVLQKSMHMGRQFEIPDILANIIGVIVAYCIFNFWLKTKYYGS